MAYMFKGAFLIFTKNICLSDGLWSGVLRTMVGLIYKKDQPPTGLMECIIVYFGYNCTGSYHFDNNKYLKKRVPVFRECFDCQLSGNSSESLMVIQSRKTSTLNICYACTIWKLQGGISLWRLWSCLETQKRIIYWHVYLFLVWPNILISAS